MNKTKIEWLNGGFTLNPVVGCTFNCYYCYARRLNQRFGWIKSFNEPQYFPERLKQLKRKKPTNIFMNSMSDIADWKDEWIDEVANAILENPQHNYLFLTKRIENVSLRRNAFELLLSMSNVWLGVTVNTNIDMFERLPILKEFVHNNCHTFISIEPIMEHIVNFNYYGIDWIIVGALTGSTKNRVKPKKKWVEDIEADVFLYDIPLFYKESMIKIVGEEDMERNYPTDYIF